MLADACAAMQARSPASNGRRLLVMSPPATTQVIKVVWIEAKLKNSSYGWTYSLSKKRAITHAAPALTPGWACASSWCRWELGHMLTNRISCMTMTRLLLH